MKLCQVGVIHDTMQCKRYFNMMMTILCVLQINTLDN